MVLSLIVRKVHRNDVYFNLFSFYLDSDLLKEVWLYIILYLGSKWNEIDFFPHILYLMFWYYFNPYYFASFMWLLSLSLFFFSIFLNTTWLPLTILDSNCYVRNIISIFLYDTSFKMVVSSVVCNCYIIYTSYFYTILVW